MISRARSNSEPQSAEDDVSIPTEILKRYGDVGYPMVLEKNTDVRFLTYGEDRGAQWQKVQVTDLKGFTYLLDYQMV